MGAPVKPRHGKRGDMKDHAFEEAGESRLPSDYAQLPAWARVVLRALWVVTFGYLALAVIAVLATPGNIYFRGMREPILRMGWLLFLVALATGMLGAYLASRAQKAPLSHKSFCRVVALSAVALLCAQIFLLYSGFFVTDWDAGGLAHAAYDPTLISTSVDSFSYFSTYPNQLFLLGVFQTISRVVKALGVESFAGTYFALAAGGCFCITVSVALLAHVAERIGGTRTGMLALVLGIVLVGLSPWLFIPYSDEYGMVFVALVIYLYTCVKKSPARTFGMVLFTALGYYIKPTVVFPLMAAAFIRVLAVVGSRKEWSKPFPWQRLAASCAAVVLAVAYSFALNTAVTATNRSQLDESKAVSLAHYLMIGANNKANGRWNEDDLAISATIDDPQERSATNLSVWRQRVSDLGIKGVLKLAVKKTVNNYLDGAFFWEGEGAFYEEVLGSNQAVKDFYNIGHTKNWIAPEENLTPLFAIEQVVWFFVLIGCVANIARKQASASEHVLTLSILAISLFLMVFECRARYLYMFSPLFVVLAARGWQQVAHAMRGLRRTRGRASHLSRV